MWIAKGMADISLSLFTLSSILIFILTSSRRNLGSAITDCNGGGNSVNGSHTSQFNSSFAWSVIGSGIAPLLYTLNYSVCTPNSPRTLIEQKNQWGVYFSILVSDWTAAVAFSQGGNS